MEAKIVGEGLAIRLTPPVHILYISEETYLRVIPVSNVVARHPSPGRHS